MNDQAMNEAFLNVISVLLVICAFAVCVFFYLESAIKDMKRMREGERDTDPQPYTPDPEHIKRVLAEYGLRKALPVYAKRDPGTSEAEARDLADLKRGTSEKLCRLLP